MFILRAIAIFGTLISVASIQAGYTTPVYRIESDLAKAWVDGSGFATFSWIRGEDKGTLYQSAIYLELNRNKLSIYNTYNRAPLGMYTRCGGLGCDLGKGSLVGTLNFKKQQDTFIVESATGQSSFLKGAQCTLDESRLLVSAILECRTNKTPLPLPPIGTPRNDMPSIFIFSPGT